MPSLIELYDVNGSQGLQRQFLICDYCFWAASATDTRSQDIVACPQCSQPLSRIPIGTFERFTFSIAERCGVELAFTSAR